MILQFFEKINFFDNFDKLSKAICVPKTENIFEQNSTSDNSTSDNSNNFYYKDKFLERLMIPIRDLDGATVGFTGRILQESPNRPKYLNSSDSQWFQKGSLWFGLDLAKRSIIKNKKALIVEGNMDVLAAHEAGFSFAIASQGTSFTLTQIQILQRLTKTVWLAFDNDLAGQIAAEKFFIMATKMGLQVWQVIIPSIFKDLDEFLHFKMKKEEIFQKPEETSNLNSKWANFANKETDSELKETKNSLEHQFDQALGKNNFGENQENKIESLEKLNSENQTELEVKLETELETETKNPKNDNKIAVLESLINFGKPENLNLSLENPSNQKVQNSNLENSQKNANSLNNKNSQKNSQIELEVIPYLDFALNRIGKLEDFNLYEQQEKIEKFLNLTLDISGILLEQTLLKLAKIAKINLKTLQEIRSRINLKNQNYSLKKTELNPEIIQKLEVKIIQTKNPNLSVAWQNLASFSVAKKLDLSLVEKLESVFLILSKFLLELSEFATFADYSQSKSDELLLIYEKIKSEDFIISKSRKTIWDFLDGQISQINQSEELTKHYKIFVFS